MSINLRFTPTKFKDASELFKRPDAATLAFPNEEPMGFLETKNGHTALVEFIQEDVALKQEESIGKTYTGPGIYLLNYSANEQQSDDFPFWVVLKTGEALTVGKTKRILSQIESILLNDEYTSKNKWSID